MHLKKLEISTANIGDMLHFYRHVLGCAVSETGGGFIIKAGTSLLEWHPGDNAVYSYHIAFAIPLKRVEEAVQWTASKVPLLHCAPNQVVADFDAWKAKAFYFLDPAGNIIEFIGRDNVANDNSSPFNGSLLASVAEIGIVTDNVPLACRQLTELWNVPFYSKQKPTHQFAALGDDDGLFIVVQEGRSWFPTQIKATKSPLTVLFETDDGIVRRLEME